LEESIVMLPLNVVIIMGAGNITVGAIIVSGSTTIVATITAVRA
jgi:hypothetical protein